MSLKERTINVDIMTKGYTKIKYKQGDSNQILKFKFYKNGTELDLTGYVAGIFYEKPNNEILEKTGTINKNTVSTTITKGVLNTAGIVKTEVFLTKGNEVSISFTILIEIEPSIDKNTAVQEKEEWDAIRDLLNSSNNVSVIDDSSTATNKTWSSSKIDSQIKEIKNEISSNITGSALRDISVGEYFIFSNGTTGMSYTITYELSNAENSNNISSINEGMSYTSTITANNGYTLDTITVTMGSVDISSTAVSGNTITINSVTGNIVITVTTTQDGGNTGGSGNIEGIVSTGLIKTLNNITSLQTFDNSSATYFDLNNSEFTVFAKCTITNDNTNCATVLGGSSHPLTMQIAWNGNIGMILKVMNGDSFAYPNLTATIDTDSYNQAGETVFIAFVGNKSNITCYINNVAQSSVLNYAGTTFTPPTSITVGGDNKNVTWMYYNRALTYEELTQNYTALGGVL